LNAQHSEAAMNIAPVRKFIGSTPVLIVSFLLGLLGAYLLWNHTGHVVYALPYLVLLACPLMRFGHRHA
jgi:hypothetical protein